MTSPHLMKKDTIIEMTEDVIDNFSRTNSLFKGEQFVVMDKMSKQGGSALIANIRNLKTGMEQEVFWVFIKHRIKIISTVEEDSSKNSFAPSDISLNENEEYVIVHKDKPNLFYRTVFYPSYHALAKDDFIEGDAIFTAKKGYRKKCKNRQSLNAFLSGIAGGRDWTITQNTPLEKIYHISGFFANTEYYYEASYSSNFVAMAKECFVIKKYNKDTKTAYDEAVKFSVKDYIENIEKKVEDTFNHGEAVSQVLGMLRENSKMDEYPYIFSTKYNAEDYKNELTIYNGSSDNIPRDKDVFFELLVKESKKKKKDLFLYNKNGFAAIACKDKEMLDYFNNGYVNPMKVVNVIETKEHL